METRNAKRQSSVCTIYAACACAIRLGYVYLCENLCDLRAKKQLGEKTTVRRGGAVVSTVRKTPPILTIL